MAAILPQCIKQYINKDHLLFGIIIFSQYCHWIFQKLIMYSWIMRTILGTCLLILGWDLTGTVFEMKLKFFILMQITKIFDWSNIIFETTKTERSSFWLLCLLLCFLYFHSLSILFFYQDTLSGPSIAWDNGGNPKREGLVMLITWRYARK